MPKLPNKIRLQGGFIDVVSVVAFGILLTGTFVASYLAQHSQDIRNFARDADEYEQSYEQYYPQEDNPPANDNPPTQSREERDEQPSYEPPPPPPQNYREQEQHYESTQESNDTAAQDAAAAEAAQRRSDAMADKMEREEQAAADQAAAQQEAARQAAEEQQRLAAIAAANARRQQEESDRQKQQEEEARQAEEARKAQEKLEQDAFRVSQEKWIRDQETRVEQDRLAAEEEAVRQASEEQQRQSAIAADNARRLQEEAERQKKQLEEAVQQEEQEAADYWKAQQEKEYQVAQQEAQEKREQDAQRASREKWIKDQEDRTEQEKLAAEAAAAQEQQEKEALRASQEKWKKDLDTRIEQERLAAQEEEKILADIAAANARRQQEESIRQQKQVEEAVAQARAKAIADKLDREEKEAADAAAKQAAEKAAKEQYSGSATGNGTATGGVPEPTKADKEDLVAPTSVPLKQVDTSSPNYIKYTYDSSGKVTGATLPNNPIVQLYRTDSKTGIQYIDPNDLEQYYQMRGTGPQLGNVEQIISDLKTGKISPDSAFTALSLSIPGIAAAPELVPAVSGLGMDALLKLGAASPFLINYLQGTINDPTMVMDLDAALTGTDKISGMELSPIGRGIVVAGIATPLSGTAINSVIKSGGMGRVTITGNVATKVALSQEALPDILDQAKLMQGLSGNPASHLPQFLGYTFDGGRPTGYRMATAQGDDIVDILEAQHGGLYPSQAQSKWDAMIDFQNAANMPHGDLVGGAQTTYFDAMGFPVLKNSFQSGDPVKGKVSTTLIDPLPGARKLWEFDPTTGQVSVSKNPNPPLLTIQDERDLMGWCLHCRTGGQWSPPSSVQAQPPISTNIRNELGFATNPLFQAKIEMSRKAITTPLRR